MSGPLSGVRVIDLTSVVSGPLGTMALGDQGADIIKVEMPQGDFTRHVATRHEGFSASFLNNNRNKRSIVLDLKSDLGKEVLFELVRNADVFVQNLRPGVMERLGIGYDVISNINPKIIYTSIAGFGFTGPYANKPVYDPLIQAVSALTTVQAGSDEERPRLVRTILPDKLTGIQASQAITAALFARERTGQGQEIHISMLDTIIAFLWGSDMGGHTFVGHESAKEEAQSFIDLVYEVADGYVSVAVMQDKQWNAFCDAIGNTDLKNDPRFASAVLREENKDERLQAIQDAIVDFNCDDLIAILEASDVPCAPVLTRTQMRQHPQVKANEILIEYDHPVVGKLRQSKHPAAFSKTVNAAPTPAPALGEQTEEILRGLNLDEEKIAEILKIVAGQSKP
ncbi:MAG: CoA transferase [Rhizobiaceae bacterium]|nr:CoA transferase [Rhizobiaceae bacterium]